MEGQRVAGRERSRWNPGAAAGSRHRERRAGVLSAGAKHQDCFRLTDRVGSGGGRLLKTLEPG